MVKVRRSVVWAAVLALGGILVAAVPAAAESITLPPPVSDNGVRINDLYNHIFIPAIPIFLLIEGALLIIIFRYRRRHPDQIPPQYHGNTRLEVVWTVLPLLVVLAIAFISFQELQQDFVKKTDAETQMDVTVSGYQFYWEYEYPFQGADGKNVTTHDTLTVPTGTTVRLKLVGKDVIHSWWVPAITGKTDAVPGYENYSWLNIKEPGQWRGECAELCGTGHADMQISVVAKGPADFQRWKAEQTAPKPTPSASTKPSPS